MHEEAWHLLVTWVPPRPKDVDGFGEDVVVDEACVDGEEPHHGDDVTPTHKHVHDLQSVKWRPFIYNKQV